MFLLSLIPKPFQKGQCSNKVPGFGKSAVKIPADRESELLVCQYFIVCIKNNTPGRVYGMGGKNAPVYRFHSCAECGLWLCIDIPHSRIKCGDIAHVIHHIVFCKNLVGVMQKPQQE